MQKALLLAKYSASGASGAIKEGLTGRRKVLESVVEAMGGRITQFWGVASGEWHIAYVMEREHIPEGDADNIASMLAVTAAGVVDELRVLPLVDTEDVDNRLGEVMKGYRPPGE